MEIVLAVVVGGLYAAATYLILRRHIVKLILGLAMLAHAANLLIFTAGGLRRARPPLVPEGALAPTGPVADPIPQALILTAIVIGFAILAFALALSFRAYQAAGTDDLDAMRVTEK
ncbi:MAG: Na+/H+ antiporter subunit C [Armatimonadota bacterium]